MTLIRENLRAATVYAPETLRARLPVPRGIVPPDPATQDGYRVYNGVPIDSMAALWPYDELRTRCVDGAKQWVRHKAGQGYELLTAEADIKVFGPYRSRAGTYSGTKKARVTGYGEDEDFNEDLADFVLEATFLSSRHRPLQTKAEA